MKRFCGQICDVILDDSAISEIYRISGGKLRKIINETYKLEEIAKVNDLETITSKHFRKAA